MEFEISEAPAGPPSFVGREEDAEGRRRFQFCIERFQSVGRLFLQLPETGTFVILKARLPEPRTVSRRTRCCGSEASEAIPFPGADSIFSSRCGAISGRLRPPPLGWVPLAPSLFQGCRFFSGSNATLFHGKFWNFCIKRLPWIPTQRAGLHVSRLLAEFVERAERARVVRDR
jgi:hypothetical protein